MHKVLIVAFMLAGMACSGQKGRTYTSPAGYDFNAPVKYNMPAALFEISGIAFEKGNPATVYAIQDEDGHLFNFQLGSKKAPYVKFGGKGDYEDLAVCRGQVIVLRSDGEIHVFPLADVKKGKIGTVNKQKNLLPKAEYEGMYAEEQSGLIYILTKEAQTDKATKKTAVFTFKLQGDGTLQKQGQAFIDHLQIEKLINKKNIKFKPSAITKNPVTKEWYILSSVNKVLLTADANFNIKKAYPLNPALFNQPEGIAFDNQHNLYISNEGGSLPAGNILLFKYNKQLK